MNHKIVVKRLKTAPKGRTIAISDIHGNLDVYKDLLKKIQYTPNVDRLILVGDKVEKGPKNLETLRYIMQQCQKEGVFCLMGNCDFTARNVLYSFHLDFLKIILTLRKKSILHDMAHEIGLSFDADTDLERYCQTLRQHFLKELSFCNDLPHVLISDFAIFAHSAIKDEQNFGNNLASVINHGFFINDDVCFKKPVVVGHLPVTEYCHTIADYNPIYDEKKNIYSIDGGNVVKKSGQLNAWIYDRGSVTYASMDHLPSAIALCNTNPVTKDPFFITWNHGNIKIIKESKDQYYVYNSYLDRTFWIEKECVHNQKAEDYTNYEMPLKKGDIVHITKELDQRVFIKKNGILGWTDIKNIKRTD